MAQWFSIPVDGQIYHNLPAENIDRIAVCEPCGTLVYNTEPSLDRHNRLHQFLNEIAEKMGSDG